MQVGLINFYGAVLNVQQERAGLIANNIANADTPNYKAVDVPFSAALAAQLNAPGATAASARPEYRANATVALNGNDVSLDGERVASAANAETMAAATTFLHQSTSDLMMALRPNPGGI